MKVVKNWNKISDKLKAEIPKLKKGEVVTFQMLNGKRNDEPDLAQREKQGLYLHAKTQISTQQRIYDPYQVDDKGKEIGGYVDIIVSDGWIGDEPARAKFFLAGIGEHQFSGKFSLTAGSIEDEELYELFWLSNERKGNKYRDDKTPALFEIVDVEKESAKKTDRVTQLREALNKAANMGVDEARKIAASLNWATTLTESVLLANINDYAATEPEHFLKIAVDNPETDLKAEIKQALDAKLINFDQTTGKVTVGTKNNLLTTFDKKADFDLLEELAAWMGSAANGEDVMKGIRKQLKK